MTGEWEMQNPNMAMLTELNEEVLSSRVIASGKRLTYREDEVRLPNGVIGRREVVEHPEAVVVIPIVAPGKVLLIRQYRTAAKRVMLEVPAGLIESGEIPLDAAQRELREETGFRASVLRPLFNGFPTPGFCTEFMYFFCGTGLSPDPLVADIDEIIAPVVMALDEALGLVATGAIVDLKTIAALYAVQVLNNA